MAKVLKIVGVVAAVIIAIVVGIVCFCANTEDDWFLQD